MKNLAILAFLIASFGAHAQQEFRTSMYWNQYAMINPATSALTNIYDGYATYRNAYPSLTANARTFALNYNMQVKSKHGVGINFVRDEFLYTKTNTLQLNYNYQLRFRRERRLSFGISPGIMHLGMDGYWIPPTGAEDPFLPEEINDVQFNANAGIAYSGKMITAGIGVTHLTSQRYLSENGLTAFSARPHFYGHAQYKWVIGRALTLVGEGIFRTDGSFSSYDLNFKARLFNQFWIGSGYRTSSTTTFFAGWDIKGRYRLAYAYDLTFSKISSASGGSHEFTLGFQIERPEQKRAVVNAFPDF